MQRFTYRARKQVLDRLMDEEYGFNQTMATLVLEPEYSEVTAIEIDFTGESDNFWLGAIGQDELAASTRTASSNMVVYTQQSVNLDNPKYQIFAGSTSVIIEVAIFWTSNQAVHDFETATDAVEETLVRVINRVEGPVMANYTGRLEIVRGPVTMGDGENWERLLRISLPFLIEVQN